MKSKPPSSDVTLDYYNRHAEQYDAQTATLEMSGLYAPFLERIPPAGRILDAGCGSGRDASAFKALGYQVTAFDASPRMCELASQRLEQRVAVLRFEEFEAVEAFNGIWACASLLHVCERDLEQVFQRLARALMRRGVLYASFKFGHGEIQRGDRMFTDLNAERLAALMARTALEVEQSWVTEDLRAGRTGELWLNALCAVE